VPGTDNEASVKTDILLEDPNHGHLFAAAPYTASSVVEQVLDSSRFFAILVQGEGGRKAVLGIGFEDRSEAFDFSVALQEVRKTLGIEGSGKAGASKVAKEQEKIPEQQDFSLKEGETITVNIGARAAGRRQQDRNAAATEGFEGLTLPPPPAYASTSTFLPPPPSAQEIKAQKRLSLNHDPDGPGPGSVEALGFDDGEFGEFQ